MNQITKDSKNLETRVRFEKPFNLPSGERYYDEEKGKRVSSDRHYSMRLVNMIRDVLETNAPEYNPGRVDVFRGDMIRISDGAETFSFSQLFRGFDVVSYNVMRFFDKNGKDIDSDRLELNDIRYKYQPCKIYGVSMNTLLIPVGKISEDEVVEYDENGQGTPSGALEIRKIHIGENIDGLSEKYDFMDEQQRSNLATAYSLAVYSLIKCKGPYHALKRDKNAPSVDAAKGCIGVYVYNPTQERVEAAVENFASFNRFLREYNDGVNAAAEIIYAGLEMENSLSVGAACIERRINNSKMTFQLHEAAIAINMFYEEAGKVLNGIAKDAKKENWKTELINYLF